MCVAIGDVRDVRRSGVAEECSRCEAVDQCNNKALRRKMHARTIFVDRAAVYITVVVVRGFIIKELAYMLDVALRCRLAVRAVGVLRARAAPAAPSTNRS